MREENLFVEVQKRTQDVEPLEVHKLMTLSFLSLLGKLELLLHLQVSFCFEPPELNELILTRLVSSLCLVESLSQRLVIPKQLEIVLLLHLALLRLRTLQVVNPLVQSLFVLNKACQSLLQNSVLLAQVLVGAPLICQVLSEVVCLLLETVNLFLLRI